MAISSLNHRCSQCKKNFETFYGVKNYAYKTKTKIFCSYSCMRKYQKEVEEVKNAKIRLELEGKLK